MVEPTFSCDIVPGKKALDRLTFFEDDILDNGIDTITEIELSFHIFDADSWDAILDTEPITITP